MISVANAGSWTFFKLLLYHWRGAVIRVLWRELLVYLAVFYTINGILCLSLDEHKKQSFHDVIKAAKKFESAGAITFILGFFVSQVMNRW
jgi:hypothetical protein